MSFLNCPRCGLSVRAPAEPALTHPCPRCAGRVGLTVPMYETERPRPPVSAPEPVADAPAVVIRRRTQPQTA